MQSAAGLVADQLPIMLFREYPCRIGKRLELQRIAGRVKQEQGGLFADLALETDIRLDDESDAGALQPLCQ